MKLKMGRFQKNCIVVSEKIKQIIVIILLVIAILSGLMVGFNITNKNVDLYEANDSTGIKIISLSTDKEDYHEGDSIEIEVLVYSPVDIENTKVTVSGITNSFGHDYLSEEKTVNFTSGENKITFPSHMPYCSSCTGISYGTYKITANVIQEDKTITTDSKNIKIEET